MVRLNVLPFAFPGLPRVGAVFTTRQGGVSRGRYASANLSFIVGDEDRAVRTNRRALRDQLGFTAWAECHQVHGEALRFDPGPDDIDGPGTLDADGLATARPGQALVIKTADCQPVLLAHESGKFVAALHVGWRGNRLDLPGSGVRRFCEAYGLRPSELLAVRGPSLGPAHSEFIHFDREFGPEFAAWHDPVRRTVDLWRLTRDQLAAAGLRPERIFGLDLCTRTLDGQFFSYRREGVSGRQAGLIWIVP